MYGTWDIAPSIVKSDEFKGALDDLWAVHF